MSPWRIILLIKPGVNPPILAALLTEISFEATSLIEEIPVTSVSPNCQNSYRRQIVL